jgi:hypothetical protein
MSDKGSSRNFSGGPGFEEWCFGRSNRRQNKPAQVQITGKFSEFVRRIVSAVVGTGVKFPDTSLAKSLHYNVQACLQKAGIPTDQFYLCASVGSNADIYYFTDALFYISPRCGGECVASIDAFHTKYVEMLREFWIEVSASEVFTEEEFQSCLFRHKMIVAQYRKEREKERDKNKKKINLEEERNAFDLWIRSEEYKGAWISDQVSWSVNDPDRPNQRPKNHFLVTQWHLPPHRLKGLAKEIATSLSKQVLNCTLPAAS